MACLSGFGIRVMVASQNEFGKSPSSAVFWKSLGRIHISSSLNFWSNLPVKPSGPGLLFAGRFLFTVLISVIVMGLLHFLFLPGSVLESCTFLRICPFLPHCPFYWHIIAEKIWNASRICVSSLHRSHANLFCIIPILVYVLPKRAPSTVF